MEGEKYAAYLQNIGMSLFCLPQGYHINKRRERKVSALFFTL